MAQILLLTPQLPYPAHQGTSLRNLNIIRGIARNHAVTLLSFVELDQQDAQADVGPLADLCVGIYTVVVPERTTGKRVRQLVTSRWPDMAHRLYSEQFAAVLHQLLTSNFFDIVQIEGIELARYINEIRVASKEVKIVFDNHNAETELQLRNFLTDLRQPRRWVAAGYSLIQVGRLTRFERWACQQADAVTAVSEADKAHLQKLAGDQKLITSIPNSIDVAAYSAAPENVIPYDLVFSGKMDYRPNVDAVLWFADAVWPQIKEKRPSATWAIVGQKPHPRLDRLRELPGVILTGWVDKVEPYLYGATVFIMPFRIGSGTRLKLIEAMAAGCCIVSTSIGAEGFPVANGQQIFLTDTANEMAQTVLFLLSSPIDRRQVQQHARDFAQNYDWRVIVPAFELVYESIHAG